MKYANTEEGEHFANLILKASIGRGTKCLIAVAVALYEELGDSVKQERLRQRIERIIDETNSEYEPGA